MSISDVDVEKMRAISEDFAKKVTGADFEGLAILYTEDAVLMPPGHPAVTGRANILKWTEAYPPVTKFEFHFDEVDGYEDIAYVRGRYLMQFTPEGSPEPVEDRGKFVEVRRKQVDGSWPIAVDTWNSDQSA